MKSNHVLLNETWVGEVGRRFRCHLSPQSLSRPRSWQSSSSFQQLWAHTALEKDEQTRTEDRQTDTARSEFCCLHIWPHRDFWNKLHIPSIESSADKSYHCLYVIFLSWDTVETFPLPLTTNLCFAKYLHHSQQNIHLILVNSCKHTYINWIISHFLHRHLLCQ